MSKGSFVIQTFIPVKICITDIDKFMKEALVKKDVPAKREP